MIEKETASRLEKENDMVIAIKDLTKEVKDLTKEVKER
jgi:hypothetical protein